MSAQQTRATRPLAYCQKNHLVAWAEVEAGQTLLSYWEAVATPGKTPDGPIVYVAHRTSIPVPDIASVADITIESFEIMCPKNHGAQIYYRLANLLPVIRGESRPLTIRV